MEHDNPKVPTFITIRHSIRSNAQDFAKLDFKSFSRLVEIALLEYMCKHADDIKKPVILNVQNVIEQPKPLKLLVENCEIAHCRNKSNGAIGVYKDKSYKLCKDHEGKYAGVPGWVVR